MTIISNNQSLQTSKGPRALLRRLREVMAVEAAAQERLDQLTRVIADSMTSDVCSIYLRRTNDQLELYSTSGLNHGAVHVTRLKWGEGLVGEVAKKAEPLNLHDAKNNPTFVYRPEVGEDMLAGFLGVPIIRSGQVIGVLVIQRADCGKYTEDAVEAAQLVATVLAEIVVAGELLDRQATEEVAEVLHRHVAVQANPIVAGVVIGQAVFYEPPTPKHRVFADDIAAESERIKTALLQLQKSVDEMLATGHHLSKLSREVLEVYRLFANDKGWARRLEDAVHSGLTAESAVEKVQKDNQVRMRAASDMYLRERLHDLDDLSRRLLRILTGQTVEEHLELPPNAILFARALGPAELLEMDQSKLCGVVLGEGADTSHAAIVARSLELALVGSASKAIDQAEEGDTIILDGQAGDVHIRPDDKLINAYQAKQALYSDAQAEYTAMRTLPCETLDGTAVDLFMNAGLIVDIPHLHETNADGVGLFRTELQFLLGQQLPNAKAQESVYREILKTARGKPVIFRTADLGSDKAPEYMDVVRESNPAMGWRGLRISIDREGLMRPQIRALIAAAAGRDLYIMLPLVTTSQEVIHARRIIQKEVTRRAKARKAMPQDIKVGAMIEIPSAAWHVEKIAAHVDFLSIGGNDLAQFFFAADRESKLLSGRYDPLHPAFLTFIKSIVDKCKKFDLALCYCGEQASDPSTALALLGLGITRLSVSATSIGPLKKMARSVDLNDFVAWFEPLLMSDAQTLRDALEDYMKARNVAI